MMIWIMAASVCGAAFSASAEESAANGASAAGPAATETSTLADTGVSLELFLPENYEQYLELENPSDFAINDNYIAIADRINNNTDSVIYICDRTIPSYKFLANAGQSPKSLNFYTSNGTTYLYYVLSDNTVFKVDLSAQTYVQERIEGFTCFSMVILEDTVFSSRTQGDATIYQSNVNTIADTVQIAQYQDCTNPVFAIYGEEVYLAANTDVYVYNGNEFVPQGKSINLIDSFAIYDSKPFSYYYTAGNGSLFQNINENESPLFESANYFSELGYSDGKVYVLNSQYDSVCGIESGKFNGYEIGKFSDNTNRIGEGASDVYATQNKLLIADTANNRVSIVDTQTKNVFTVSVPDPKFICGGEKDFLVSDSRYVYIYSYDGTRLQSFPAETFNGVLTGCAYSFGNYYLVGSGISTNGVFKTNESGEYYFTASSANFSPTSVTCDIYGNIYILIGNSVFMYTEETFLAEAETGNTRAFFAPDGTFKILSDYKGTMYAVTAGGIYLLDSTKHTLVLDSENFSKLVYSDKNFSALSFTFDLENGDMYILSDGFVAKADLGENSPAALNNIDAEGLYESLHGSPAKDDAGSLLVNVPAGSVLLSADSAITSPTEVYPYAGYTRIESSRTGVRICTLEAGTVVAFYEYTPSQQAGVAPAREYSIALVLNNADNPITQAGGYTASSGETTGYTTNSVGLYRFPLMQVDGRTIYSGDMTERLAKSTKLAVLGTIQSTADENAPGFGLDFSYYFVEAIVDGKTVYGFIPTAYILSYDAGASWEGEPFSYRNVRRGESITLQNSLGTSLELSNEERVRVYGEPNEENLVYVVYVIYDKETGDIISEWSGMIDADLLYEAGPSSLIILAVVALVTAVVLVSSCYLILRKQPTMQ